MKLPKMNSKPYLINYMVKVVVPVRKAKQKLQYKHKLLQLRVMKLVRTNLKICWMNCMAKAKVLAPVRKPHPLLKLPLRLAAEPYLLMAEEPGCYWCGKWNAEIGPIYPKTAEGGSAPLRRYDLRRDSPPVAFERKVRFTPTFILVQDGKEVARIEGYPGEDFFWGLLAAMLEQADIPLDQSG